MTDSKKPFPFAAFITFPIMRRRNFLKLTMATGAIVKLNGFFANATVKAAAAGPIVISGRYPHLAMFNHQSECGIGAVVPRADRLWVITYSPHYPHGSNDGLYEITRNLQMLKRPESIGGTCANRMIHQESGQLFIGPYAIDQNRNVRAIPFEKMPGRHTANARHLTQPGNKLYYFTMEEGLYEVDVQTLDTKELQKDANVDDHPGPAGPLLPGYHGKGAYTAQGRVVYANNGEAGAGRVTDIRQFRQDSGCLAEWDGEQWSVVERAQFNEVTGPGGLSGNPNSKAPLWATGWDHRSLIVKLLDGERWYTYRLPKSDYSYDGQHGWYTEWPRIRQVGPNGEFLMNMHGGWFQFPGDFRRSSPQALKPIAQHLKITGDFARWNNQIVFGCDDTAITGGNELAGQSHSNLWFTEWKHLFECGRPAGWGGLWVRDNVGADTPSAPFLMEGYRNRQLHLAHGSTQEVNFKIELDRDGSGRWEFFATIQAPPAAYTTHSLDDDGPGQWLRLSVDRNVESVTAYFHYGQAGGATPADQSMFNALAKATSPDPYSIGWIRPRGGDLGTLHLAAWNVDAKGNTAEAGYYEIGPDMRLRHVNDPEAHAWLKRKAAIDRTNFEVDAASAIAIDHEGNRLRLPKNDLSFDESTESGRLRALREVVTERDLLNLHGTFYCVPRPNAGGLRRMKPVATHNRRISDFCSWRGLLVLAGCRRDAVEDGHYIRSDDGNVGLWFGDIDDLWKLGKPVGHGGPWLDAEVQANTPSDPYLLTGYTHKQLTLSHNIQRPVVFTLEIDFLADDSWHVYREFTVPAGERFIFSFPVGYNAHWARLGVNRECRATAQFEYT